MLNKMFACASAYHHLPSSAIFLSYECYLRKHFIFFSFFCEQLLIGVYLFRTTFLYGSSFEINKLIFKKLQIYLRNSQPLSHFQFPQIKTLSKHDPNKYNSNRQNDYKNAVLIQITKVGSVGVGKLLTLPAGDAMESAARMWDSVCPVGVAPASASTCIKFYL